MNSDTFDRMKEAGKYQKMALRALFPEQAAGHLDVIEGELKAMMKELVMDMVKQEVKKQYAGEDDTVNHKKESTNVRKVKIL